jgi:hypothetical protein
VWSFFGSFWGGVVLPRRARGWVSAVVDLKEAVEQRCLSLVQGKNGSGLWAAGCLWKMAEFGEYDTVIDDE